MWGEIQLHPYVGGALEARPKAPPHRGRGVWGEALENA